MRLADDELRVLVRRAAGRDADAWAALYRRAYPRLFAYACRRLPTPGDAEDAVSETMMRAIDGIQRFTWRGAGFDAWLYGILRHVVYEMTRQQRRRAQPLIGDPPGNDVLPLDRILSDERDEFVRQAFARLSPRDRELLELRVVGELNAAEVGLVVGKRAGAVRMAQRRALARLRQALEQVTDGQ
ncbi:MAG: RNA polymerase sigma factor [Egibacteraceae bacterium]